jgi:hypothetical protein
MSKNIIRHREIEKVNATQKSQMVTIANKIIELIRTKHV